MIKYLSILRLYSFFTKVVPINSPYHLQYCCFGCLPRFNLVSPSTDFLVAKVLLSSEYFREKNRRNENLEKERNHGVHMFVCDYLMTCIFLISWEWIEPTWKMVNYEYQLLTLIALFTKFLLEMILNIKDLDSGYFNFLKCLVQFIICIISLVQMI